jgi:hypothetical protein
MKKFLLTVIVYVCILAGNIFGLTFAREYFIIHNLSNGDIRVVFETIVEPNMLPDGTWFFEHMIDDIPIAVNQYSEWYNVIGPNELIKCIYYYPIGIWQEKLNNNYYTRLREIPVLDQIKSIFKTFTVIDAEGNILVTLNDIKEDNIIVEENGHRYITLKICGW